MPELSKLEQESVIEFMTSEVGLNHQDNCQLMSSKAKAISPTLKTICGQLNELLDAIIKDINEYTNSDNNNGDDNDFILTSVQKCAAQNMQDFLSYVDKHLSEVSKIGCGRLLQFLPEESPSLRTCILAPKMLKVVKPEDLLTNFSALYYAKSSSTKTEPEWQSLKSQLEQKANHLFKLWIESVTRQLRLDLDQSLVNDSLRNLEMMPAWDTIEISEKGEDGQVIRSKIRVPQHLSLPAFDGMMKLCQSCHLIGVHSLPHVIQQELTQQSALVFAQSYDKYCASNAKLTQNVALQVHFDIQFVMQSMVSHDNSETNGKCQAILDKLENHIDPFDFSVFNPYMSVHVKKAILRHHTILSVMLPNDKYTYLPSLKASLPSTNGSNGIITEQSNEHNVMIMAPNCSRFSLLPVTSSNNSQRGREIAKKEKTLTASNLNSKSAVTSSPTVRKRSKSPVARAANSFFEAMSSSWWGTK